MSAAKARVVLTIFTLMNFQPSGEVEMNRPTVILVGGFLGAGKTTLLATAAERLAAQGKRVALVTNDQAANLVDTAVLKEKDLPVDEVSGGCFCCKFDDLIGAMDHLVDAGQPDVLLGEPVGSCTDLSATVMQPMKALQRDRYRLAPLSVLVDPDRVRGQLVKSPATAVPSPLPRQRALHLSKAARGGRPHRAEQGRSAHVGRAGRDRRRPAAAVPSRSCDLRFRPGRDGR